MKFKRLLTKFIRKSTEWLFIHSMTSFLSPLKHLTSRIDIAEEM
ncbi:MAG: hypothetical protein ACK5B3_03375 [Bacteroidota bacterium]